MRARTKRRRRGPSSWKALLGLILAAAGIAGIVLARLRRRSPEPAAGAEPPPRLASRQGWIAGPAGTLYLEEAGAGGAAVLLVHGLAGSLQQWRPLIELLARRRRVVALDLRGHGRSDPAALGGYEVEDYAADVMAVADALRLRRFTLAGHSLGGLVAIECAASHAERVTALALVDPNGDSSELPPAQTEPVLEAIRREPRAELELHYRQFLLEAVRGTAERVLEDLAQTPEELLPVSLAAAMSYPAAATLDRYRGPALCLATALNDSPQSLARLRPALPRRRVRGTSHWLMLDRPEVVAAALEELLAASEAPGGAEVAR
jgi:pimeloyl-ACP methyl ester carboxylesterase